MDDACQLGGLFKTNWEVTGRGVVAIWWMDWFRVLKGSCGVRLGVVETRLAT